MNLEKAKQLMKLFLGDRILTFNIKHYPEGGWTAECNEIPAIFTCGEINDITEMDRMMRDAIVTAAGISSDFSSQVLRLSSINEDKKAILSSYFYKNELGKLATYDIAK